MQKKLQAHWLELCFTEQKTGGCCFMQINVSPHHEKFIGVFLKVINIYIVTESIIFNVLQLFTYEKVKLEKKQQKLFRKCSANRFSVKLSKIHRKVPVPELAPVCNFIKKPRRRWFPV